MIFGLFLLMLQLTKVASAGGGCSSPCSFYSWKFGKCSYPIFFIFSLLLLLTWIFWSVCVLSFILLYVLCVGICRPAFVCLSPFQDLTMKLSLIQSVGLIAKAISECVKKQGYVFSRKQELITVMLVSSQSLKTSHICFITDTTRMVLWCLLLCQPLSGFYQGRASWFIEDSSTPSCDDHLRQPNVSLRWKKKYNWTLSVLRRLSFSLSICTKSSVHKPLWCPCILELEVLSFPSVLSLTLSASDLWTLCRVRMRASTC